VFKLPRQGGISFLKRDLYDPTAISRGSLDADTVALTQVNGAYMYAYDIVGGRPDWQYFGVSPIFQCSDVGDESCICLKSHFDVDAFGRLNRARGFRFFRGGGG